MDGKNLQCFKAYDIRGKVPQDLSPELVRKIGLACAAEFAPRNACIGYDVRKTSLDFAKILASALQDGGVNVCCIGLCGTEEVYHASFAQDFDLGIMITASHNPKEWNGFKIVKRNGSPVHSENGLNEIKNRILSDSLPISDTRGSYSEKSFKNEYIQYLLHLLGTTESIQKLAPLRILANAGNGCAWPTLEILNKHLPCEIIPLHPTPDGNFPNGVPNPLLPELRDETSRAVLENKADFGIAFDGDYDRCFFFDEQGRFIEGYYLVGLIAQTLLSMHPQEKILHDPRLIWNTQELVLKHGGIAIETRTGHAFMKERLQQENAIYGGEMSAHHYFRDFSYCDSGMLAWLYIYRLLSESGKQLSELIEERTLAYPVSGEINLSVFDGKKILEALERRYKKDALHCTFIDGLSLEYTNWRCNVRLSNTEPLLRINIETRANQTLLDEKTKEILDFIDQTDQENKAHSK